MRRFLSLLILFAAIIIVGWFFFTHDTPPALVSRTVMHIDSTMFHDGTPLAAQLTCDGGDARPPLTFTDIPNSAQSMAIVVQDLDAPATPTTHWVVWNITPTIASLRNDTLPDGAVEGANSFGKQGWTAPCPPTGETHRYVFTVYALDTMLALTPDDTYDRFAAFADGHILAVGSMTGTYARGQ